MSNTDNRASDEPKGLFRTLLVGEGASLTDAFSIMKKSEKAHNKIDIPKKQITSAQLEVPPKEGRGYWELININSLVYAVISNCEFNDVRTEIVPPEDFLEIHICFNGPVHLDLSDNEEFNSVSPFIFLSKQGESAEYKVRFEPGEKHMLALYLRPSVTRIFGMQANQLPLTIDKLLHTPPDSIRYMQIPITIAILGITSQIINNAYTGNSHILYAEAKIWELLCIIFDELSKNKSWEIDNISEMISGNEMEMFERARTTLENNLEATPTISELAKILGTNTTKLKQGFKLVFGMTIFECSHQYKMREALRLLVEKKLTVGQVADAVGYQHQASFAAAFKEYYNILPKEAKKLSGTSLPTPPDTDIST